MNCGLGLLACQTYQSFPNIHKTKRGPNTIRRWLEKALGIVCTQDIEGKFLESL